MNVLLALLVQVLVAFDEPLVELETDAFTIEVPAPSTGTLGEITAKDGEAVAVGALLGRIIGGCGACQAGRAVRQTSEALSFKSFPNTAFSRRCGAFTGTDCEGRSRRVRLVPFRRRSA